MVLEEALNKTMKHILSDLADIIVQEADQRIRVDTGELKGSMEIDYPSDLEVIVNYKAPHAHFIEYGTIPHMPPVDPLIDWCRRHGIPERVAWAIATNIKKYGQEARPFLRPAVDIARFRAGEVAKIHLNNIKKDRIN